VQGRDVGLYKKEDFNDKTSESFFKNFDIKKQRSKKYKHGE